jgi:hypothetical protein
MSDEGHKQMLLNSSWKSTGMAIIYTADDFTISVSDFTWEKATKKATQPTNTTETVTVETKFPYTWVY